MNIYLCLLVVSCHAEQNLIHVSYARENTNSQFKKLTLNKANCFADKCYNHKNNKKIIMICWSQARRKQSQMGPTRCIVQTEGWWKLTNLTNH